MALPLGADRLLDTVLRPGSSGRVRPPVQPGVSLERWPQGRRKATRWRAPVSGRRVDGFGCRRSRSAFKTCLEATQWKVLVTFLSIWLCPDAMSGPRGLAEPRQSDRMARVSWKRRKAISGDTWLLWAATLLRAMSQLFVGRVHSSSGVESPSIQD